MRFDDPVGYCWVWDRHRLYKYDTLATLLPRDWMTWSVVTSTIVPERRISRIDYSGEFNRKVTGLVRGIQDRLDSEVRRGDAVRSRRAAGVLSGALQAAGRSLMDCRASERRSTEIAGFLEAAVSRAWDGSPFAVELPRLLADLGPLGCLELAA